MPGISEDLFVDQEKLNLRLYCSICLDVAEAAVITSCNHLFCNECIEQLQSVNGYNCECPNCRKPVQPVQPATSARNYLAQQLVYCSDVESLRCGWTGKYSMWHTHRAKYCNRATKADKTQAKNARSSEIGKFSKDELLTMGVARLRKIIQEYIKLNSDKVTQEELQIDYNYKNFIEKQEYITAILKFEARYGISAKFNNKSPSKDQQLTEFPTTYDGLKKLKIKQLSAYLKSKDIDPRAPEYNCIEKSDLIKLVLKTQQHFQAILSGKAYDPSMERAQYPSSPQFVSPQFIPDYKENHEQELSQHPGFDLNEIDNSNNNFQSEYKENDHLIHNNYNDNNNNNEYMNNNISSSAYQFGINDLRRSSINRVDINEIQSHQQQHSQQQHSQQQQQQLPQQTQIPSQSTYSHVYDTNNPNYRTQLNPNQSHSQQHQPSTYSHVFDNHQHQTHLNRNNLYNDNQQINANNYGAMPQNNNINHNNNHHNNNNLNNRSMFNQNQMYNHNNHNTYNPPLINQSHINQTNNPSLVQQQEYMQQQQGTQYPQQAYLHNVHQQPQNIQQAQNLQQPYNVHHQQIPQSYTNTHSQSNIYNNFNHQSHPYQQPQQQQQQHRPRPQPQQQRPNINLGMGGLPGMREMNEMFNSWSNGMPGMPNISQIVNNAMNTVQQAVASIPAQIHQAQQQQQQQQQQQRQYQQQQQQQQMFAHNGHH